MFISQNKILISGCFRLSTVGKNTQALLVQSPQLQGNLATVLLRYLDKNEGITRPTPLSAIYLSF